MTNEMEQLIREGYSLIPLKENSKKPPLTDWKRYQNRRPTAQEIFSWFKRFGIDINFAIVCGKVISVVDVDNSNQLPELRNKIPNLFETTCVKTSRPNRFHFYFSINGTVPESDDKFLGLEGVELKSRGRYVVAPGSVVDGVRYEYEKPLTCLKQFPHTLFKLKEVLKRSSKRILFKFRGKSKCISQILKYDLSEGQRELGYFIAYSKLLEAGNSSEYAINTILLANENLGDPLEEKEIKTKFNDKKIYHYGCPKINKELNFINCNFCQVRGGNKVKSLQMANIHKLFNLSNSARGILSLIDTYYRGEDIPSIYELKRKTGGNFYMIRDALEELKEKKVISTHT